MHKNLFLPLSISISVLLHLSNLKNNNNNKLKHKTFISLFLLPCLCYLVNVLKTNETNKVGQKKYFIHHLL